MHMRKSVLSSLIFAAGSFAVSAAHAQLVVGTTTGAVGNVSAYYIDLADPNNVVAKPLWAFATAASNGSKVNGMAADATNGVLYSNNAARLNSRPYGAAAGVRPTTIAGLYRSNGTTTSATGFDDLCMANGVLYGWTAFASTTFKRGIYQIPTTPNASNQLITTALWTDTSATPQYDFKGLCYDSASGKFIGLQNPVTSGAVGGIYSIDAFGTGAVTKLADLPTGRTEVDGLAIGGGRWWLTEKDRASQNIYIYAFDPSTTTYTDTYQLAYPDSAALASGATWAPGLLPEPSAMAVLPLAGLLVARRRK
jgi:hypothetical protein